MAHRTFYAVVVNLNLVLTEKPSLKCYKTYTGLIQSKDDLIQAALPFARHFCVRSITGAKMCSGYSGDSGISAKITWVRSVLCPVSVHVLYRHFV